MLQWILVNIDCTYRCSGIISPIIHMYLTVVGNHKSVSDISTWFPHMCWMLISTNHRSLLTLTVQNFYVPNKPTSRVINFKICFRHYMVMLSSSWKFHWKDNTRSCVINEHIWEMCLLLFPNFENLLMIHYHYIVCSNVIEENRRRICIPLWVRGCIRKFPDWVDNEVNNNNKHSLRSNTKGYGGKTY
jgi:hypothetical protein